MPDKLQDLLGNSQVMNKVLIPNEKTDEGIVKPSVSPRFMPLQNTRSMEKLHLEDHMRVERSGKLCHLLCCALLGAEGNCCCPTCSFIFLSLA